MIFRTVASKFFLLVVFIYTLPVFIILNYDITSTYKWNFYLSDNSVILGGLYCAFSVLLSFLIYDILFIRLFSLRIYSNTEVVFYKFNSLRFYLLNVFLFLFVCVFLYYFFNLYNQVQWGLGKDNFVDPFFTIIFRYTGFIIAFLGSAFLIFKSSRHILLVLFVVLLSVPYFLLCLKSSSRSDLIFVLFPIAASLYYISSFKQKLILVFLFSISVVYLNYIFLLERGYVFASDTDGIPEFLIYQDYFAPVLTLYMSIDAGFVKGLDAIENNILNSIPFINITDLSLLLLQTYNFNFERGVGFAFSIFSDGYSIFSFFGVFYSAICLALFMFLMNLPCYDDGTRIYAEFLGIVFLFFVFHLIRNQFGIFIKIIIVYSPLILFLFYTSNIKIKLMRKR